mmetsp:Transcript_14717/g.35963  ORF Transcript_14717/g.35963 Transcript_14717/m.35963 type:complete len:888 (+) Transcript_14717:236-2899(+)
METTQVTGLSFGVHPSQENHQQQGGGSPSTIPTTTMPGKESNDGVAPMDTTPPARTTATYKYDASTMASTTAPAARSPSSSPVPFSIGTDVRSFPPSMSQYGSKITLDDEQSSTVQSNRPNHHGSSSNLLASPMSCSTHINAATGTWSAPSSTTNTPTVPAVILTGIGPNAVVSGSGPTPYFPTMPTSTGGGGNGKTVHVAAKKKHQIKASASSTSLHSADGSFSVMSSNGGNNINVAGSGTGNGNGKGSGKVTARRQKRLERNRESARLSRRRRKHYLEVLEEKVSSLSLETDHGRRAHARLAVDKISQLRAKVHHDVEGSTIVTPQRALDLLDGPLSRTSNELLAASTFWSQQLKSFALAPHTKAIMWLTLQSDVFYRGGRASSERLSAARIGERMLNSGNDKVPPIRSMWPLVCNEVGLSYEQEERLRTYQRSVLLPDESTWLHRHTARASGLAMQSAHDAVGSVTNLLSKREQSLKPILTPEQRVKFLSWAAKNAGRISARFEQKRRQHAAGSHYRVTPTNDSQSMETQQTKTVFGLVKENHIACNLYFLNHRLQESVVQKFPYQGLEITAAALKKLSRRASFESLGQQKDTEGRLLKRDDSFASSGSLSVMNSASNASLAGMDDQGAGHPQQHATQMTPEEAEQAAVGFMEKVLGPIKHAIPLIATPVAPQEFLVVSNASNTSEAKPEQVYSSTQTIDHYHHGHGTTECELDPAQFPEPTPVLPASSSTMPQVASAPLLTTPSAHISQPHYQPVASSSPLHSQGTVLVAQPSQITYAHQYQQPQPGQQYIQQPPQHAQIVYTSAPMLVVQAPPGAPLAAQPAPAPPIASNHVRKSSFLPSHLNAVPEDMFPTTGDVAEDDFFIGLMEDEDWAIGGGMDLSTD